MDIAQRVSEQSYAKRLKVGAVFVAESGMMTIGYNGTLAGRDNTCEYEVIESSDMHMIAALKTKDEVVHAEMNALLKLLKEGVSAKGGTLFLTHAPCLGCSKMIAGSSIKEVIYKSEYRSDDGLKFLDEMGVSVTKFSGE